MVLEESSNRLQNCSWWNSFQLCIARVCGFLCDSEVSLWVSACGQLDNGPPEFSTPCPEFLRMLHYVAEGLQMELKLLMS